MRERTKIAEVWKMESGILHGTGVFDRCFYWSWAVWDNRDKRARTTDWRVAFDSWHDEPYDGKRVSAELYVLLDGLGF